MKYKENEVIKLLIIFLHFLPFFFLVKHFILLLTAVSHIPDCGDTLTSPAGDTVFSAGDAASLVGDVHISRR
jgi:hypothetical protein